MFHRRCSVKCSMKKEPEKFAQFTGKHLSQILLLIGSPAASLKKKGSNACVFLWVLRDFSEHLFCKTAKQLRATASAEKKYWFKTIQ